MKIYNRRYTGSKYKLVDWIKEKMLQECKGAKTFFDVFGGTGVVTAECLDLYDEFYINDFLYSNELIYKGFFGREKYSKKKLIEIKNDFNSLSPKKLKKNYVSENYGDKYFSMNDALLIGYVREAIEQYRSDKVINEKEYNILLCSLLYSFDRISNTVGHYEAFIKGHRIEDKFSFDLIEPYNCSKPIHIFREDSNELSRKIESDIAFVDPPYNSRQYSRFYHVMETIIKWDKPELKGTAMKPARENMSDYCRNNAPVVFADLIKNLKCKYIVVTYNNTYTSKSTSSQNKITLEQIQNILESVGKVQIFTHKHNAFNAGKTDLRDHKEYLFICKRDADSKRKQSKSIRSPLFYVGDKYKLMPQLSRLFPDDIHDYFEPFVGGGSSFLNTNAKRYYLNDIDPWIIRIHRELNKYLGKEEKLLAELYKLIDLYGLTCTYKGVDVPEGYRQKYVKTYFARANKESYLRLRQDFNNNQNDIMRLYLLLIYGFNHMIRFNAAGEFNLPVGNVDFNKNVYEAIHNYLSICQGKDISFYALDYKKFIDKMVMNEKSYIYMDPPYLISYSEYNKYWTESDEIEMYDLLDELNDRNIRFGITNLIRHKGKTNTLLEKWSEKYCVYNIKSNYISFNDNTIKDDSQEIFVTNYKTHTPTE